MPIRSVNPATEEELASFEEHTPEDVERALARAWAARQGWRDTPVSSRAARFAELSAYLRHDRPRLAALLTAEMGKPVVEAEAEVDKCAWTAEWFAEHVEEMLAPLAVPANATESYVRFQPLGVILAVMPWNFPLWQASWSRWSSGGGSASGSSMSSSSLSESPTLSSIPPRPRSRPSWAAT